MKKSNNKIINFLKANAVYFVLSLCIIAVGLSVTLMLVNRDKILDNELSKPVIETPDAGDDNQDTDTVIKVVSFIMPVENASQIGEYSELPVFNQTLDRFSTHLSMDFYAEEGTPVYAVMDGTVESVTSTLLQGVTIVIDHGNGLKTYYNSLADGEGVVEGQQVKQGDVIGEVSSTNRQEAYKGAHLCFSATENGQAIDPAKYLVFNEK